MIHQNQDDHHRPSALACTACRAKHVKCDAKSPTCSRCKSCHLPCEYVQSRRGLRSHQKETAEIHSQTMHKPGFCAKSSHQSASALVCQTQSRTCNVPILGSVPGTVNSLVQDLNFNRSSNFNDENFRMMDMWPSDLHDKSSIQVDDLQACVMEFPTSVLAGTESDCNLDTFRNPEIDADAFFINEYYSHLHAAHPFPPPLQLVQRQPNLISNHLRDAMVFAGSQYAGSETRGIQHRAMQCLRDETTESVFYIQALMLLSITFHTRSDEQNCILAMNKAIRFALKIELFDDQRVKRYAQSFSILEESFRRTWWELENLDVQFTTFHPNRYFRQLHHIKTDHYLPCEELIYTKGNLESNKTTMNEFKERIFSERSKSFSSYAYRIEATRLLDKAQSSANNNEDFSCDNTSRSLNASLANFYLSLPQAKQEFSRADGSIDEISFSAMITAASASILFHFPRSELAFISNQHPTECTKLGHPTSPTLSKYHHTSKAMTAADSISDAITSRICLNNHTPFLICTIALASAVHLAAYIIRGGESERHLLRERLQLSISSLQVLGEVWPIARVVKSQVSNYARQVLFGGRADSSSLSNLMQYSDPPSLNTTTNDEAWLDRLLNDAAFTNDENVSLENLMDRCSENMQLESDVGSV